MIVMAVAMAGAKTLHERQQDFVDLKFGLFIHFGMGTYLEADWADPDCPPSRFNPVKLDCGQWADAAKAANMKFACMSVKHHNGFAMWNTGTTDYNVMNSGVGRDVVREFVDSMRSRGLKVMYHFSILDMHEKILPNHIEEGDLDFIKNQLRELLTNYGPIEALMIDGWDAPWSRISYDDISFEEIYRFVKSLQPECLVMDLNGAKYPADGLFYTDIKTYEQGAGQRISKDDSFLPSMACDHLQRTWFWKESFPTDSLTPARDIVSNNIVPMNEVGCTFILNAAPNRDGLIDDNAVARLREIGRIWHDDGSRVNVAETGQPLIYSNLAKHLYVYGSWSDDCNLHDLAADDDFRTAWVASPAVASPWIAVDLGDPQFFNTVVITDLEAPGIRRYAIDRMSDGVWKEIFSGNAPTDRKVKVHRFPEVEGSAVRIRILEAEGPVRISEIGVYCEGGDR